MGRKARIFDGLGFLLLNNVIKDFACWKPGSGKVWLVIGSNHSERAMSTREVEWYIMGALAALDAKGVKYVR